MLATLLTAHIILMIVSLVATTGMTIGAIAGFATARPFRRANLIITCTGILFGIVLLAHHPTGSRCIELTLYIVAFALTYRFVSKRSEKLALVSL